MQRVPEHVSPYLAEIPVLVGAAIPGHRVIFGTWKGIHHSTEMLIVQNEWETLYLGTTYET